MASSYRSANKEVKRVLLSALDAGAFRVAKKILADSNARIERNNYHEGLGLGPGRKEQDLIASGYIVGGYGTEIVNGYADAVARSSFGRDGRRGLFAQPAVVTAGPREVRYKIAYALQRAIFMHEGYYSATGEKWMFGLPFLGDAHRENWSLFRHVMVQALKEVETVHVVTRAQAGQAAEEKNQGRILDEIDQQIADADAFYGTDNPLGVRNPIFKEFTDAHTILSDKDYNKGKISDDDWRRRNEWRKVTRSGYFSRRGKWVRSHTVTVRGLEDYDKWVQRLQDLFSNWETSVGRGAGGLMG